LAIGQLFPQDLAGILGCDREAVDTVARDRGDRESIL
jgi:hypothetical protein